MNQPQLWRFIPLLNLDGKTQMAIDEWLLNQHQQGNQPPCLRFYTFNPPAITLGISQRKKIPYHWHNLTWQGQKIDLVQRPTGGRGVLHQGDLTYAVITSHLEGNLEAVYRQICQFLIMGWQRLEIDLHFGKPSRQYLKSANCFALATEADLIDGEGNKFIGSAQLRKGKFILQHGSMILNPDRALFQEVFPNSTPLINRQIESIEKVIVTLMQMGEECFNCQFITQSLSTQEWTEIAKTQNCNITSIFNFKGGRIS